MPDMTVAKTILAQLGGNKFIAMTGAWSFASSSNTLSFKLPASNAKKISGVVIELTPDDLYTLTFFHRRPFPVCIEKGAVHEGIYADMLTEIFTAETGLACSL